MFSKVILSESVYSLISELILSEFDGIYKGVAMDTFLRFSLSIILGVILGVILGFILGFILRLISRIILSLIISLVFSLALSLRIDYLSRFYTAI
jgi:hypothetical protein